MIKRLFIPALLIVGLLAGCGGSCQKRTICTKIVDGGWGVAMYSEAGWTDCKPGYEPNHTYRGDCD